MINKLLLILLLLTGIVLRGYAQEQIVTGKVTALEDGSLLPGVNISVKGTPRGTNTDNAGQYRISVAPNEVLVFSFVGSLTQEITVGTRTTLNVVLKNDASQLEEVVVTALGITKQKKGLGFSEKTLNNAELTVARTTNLSNALTGKISGVRVAGSNGATGSSSAIFIRGFTTFTGSNQPLFVVDGIPIDNGGGGAGTGSLGSSATQTGVSNSNRGIDLNQDDIETITVLKGPAAAALYGSRAAGGAILVTTKKGKATGNKKSTVSYSGSYNVVEVNRFPDYQNEYSRGTSLNAQGVPAAPVYQPNADQLSWGLPIDGRLVPSSYSAADRTLFGLSDQVPLTAYPNNVRDMFRQGSNMQHNIAFSGATDRSNYYFSYNDMSEKGYMEGNKLNRRVLSANASSKLSQKLTVGTNIQYINNTSQRSQIGNQLSNPLFRGWFLPRDYDLKNEPSVRPDGSQVYFNGVTDNPYWTLRNNLYNDERNRLIGNVNLNLELTDWLTFSSRAGTDLYTERRKTVDAIGARGQANHAVGGVGAVGDRTIYRQETSFYNNLIAKRKLSDNFDITALLGSEVNIRKTDDMGVVGNTLVTRGFDNITNATNFVPFNDVFRSRLFGVYANVDLKYRSWATVSLTGRNDWSSTFKRGNRSYFYPSISGSLVLSEALPAMASANGNGLNFLKLKSSWAKVGREAPIYATDTYFENANPGDGFGPNLVFPLLGSQGRTLSDVAGNPNLGPEFTRSAEVGVEARFWQNRLSFEVVYFNTRTTDIILAVPIAAASGFTSQARNAGVLKTQGIEIDVNITPVKTASFRWDIGFNATSIANDVVSLAPGVQNISLGPFTTAQGRLQENYPYGALFANTLLRTEPNNPQAPLVINGTTGLPIADTRGLQYVGNPNPRWTGGITNNISFKGLTLNFLLDIRRGGDFLSRVIGDIRRTGVGAETAALPRFGADGLPLRNYTIDGLIGRFNPDGTVTTERPNDIAISAQQNFAGLYAFNFPGMYVMDVNWVRLREASLSYKLPQSLLGKTPFGSMEIGVNGRNLLLWTNVPYIDPEASVGGAGNLQGVEFNTLPQSRTYGVFARFSF
ncbi:MAG: SusC/RagA family TonB-linked outer membrane protein [Cytophagaceae bacterium]|nr:SusC/RagA family TonB-linked outer membrane protein [Cytophagaceae bacterium]